MFSEIVSSILWSIGGFGLFLAGEQYEVAPWWAGWALGVLAILVPFTKWTIKELRKKKKDEE